jgi:hypothetical protein
VTTLETGLEVSDIASSAEFARRRIHDRDLATQMEGMRRIARAFVESPETILQELVKAAVELCGADSAGISIEKQDGSEDQFYQWIATAGEYTGFLDALLPRYPSACGICLERGRPQHFRVSKQFFDILNVEAPLVTDGILLPWHVDEIRGTIFIMAHGREEAFDQGDCGMMQMLADFAAAGFKQQRQQRTMLEQASTDAAAAVANDLAHKINNPLQSLTNLLYLAAEGHNGEDAKPVGQSALVDLSRLSALVKQILELPLRKSKRSHNTPASSS